MRTPHVTITQGLPASGKSTWAKAESAKNTSIVRVNKDDLRSMLFDNAWKPKREKQVLAARDAMIVAALIKGHDVIVDDTNFHPSHIARIEQLAADNGATCSVKVFHVDVDEAIKRDAKRAYPVGEQVILNMYRQYVMPTPAPQDRSLPHAIIVDVDGTLADMGDRDPYRDDLAATDTVRPAVKDVLVAYFRANPNVRIIIMSGRDEGRSREVTRQWLIDNLIPFDALHMRSAGDVRKDNIIKRELFDTHIRGRFFVRMVLDDRDSVVRMWRDELGLDCLQVNWGAF